MQLLTATLTKPARQVTTKYGQTVSVSKDSKGKINLIESAVITTNPTQTQQTPPQGMTTDQKRAIAQYIQEQRDLLAFCLDQATTIPQAQTDESIENLGITLYLSTQRKFKLA